MVIQGNEPSKQDPRLLQEVGDLSVYLTYYQKRCKMEASLISKQVRL